MKKSCKKITSMILVFFMILLCPFYVLAENQQSQNQETMIEDEGRKEEKTIEEKKVEALAESDASFYDEEKSDEEKVEESQEADSEIETREEKETEETNKEDRTETEAETETESETETETETETQTEEMVSFFSSDKFVSGKIDLDGKLDDWKNVAHRDSGDSDITYWKTVFDEEGNLYFCFTGTAKSEWDSNYQWKSVALYGMQGEDARQLTGGWSIENWGGKAVFVNEAHFSSPGSYYVEVMIPSGYIMSNRCKAIKFANCYIEFAAIEIVNGKETEKPEEEKPVYQGIVIDGKYDDWKAVSITSIDDTQIQKVAMVFDGSFVYIYMEEIGNATEAGSHGNGMFAITTDLNRTLKIQLKDQNTVNGIPGAKASHVGSKWEISIPKERLPQYKESISFGLYMEEPWIKDVSNLDGSKGETDPGSQGGGNIRYDGLFGDWDNYPHTLIQYSTPGGNQTQVDGEAALYSDGTTLFGHVVTNMPGHLQEAGGEFTSAVTIRFNDEYSQCFYPRFVTVDHNGNINWNPQLSGLASGKHEFYIASLDAWGTSGNLSQLNQADTMYGKITISIGSQKDEMEYYLDLGKIAKKFGCDVHELKVISAQYGRIGQEWVTIAGATTLPWVILMLCLILVWIYLLRTLRISKLYAWRFLVGSLGMFAALITLLQDILTMPLSQSVAALSGIAGKLFGAYSAFFKYGIIFIATKSGSMTLQIDFECSGIIEIFAFLSLLTFFDLYKKQEKIILGIVGVAYIIICNALRITLICLAVHYFGSSAYYVMHTFVGRIFFYILSVILYFYIFTKPQTVRMKVGQFTYGIHKKTT